MATNLSPGVTVIQGGQPRLIAGLGTMDPQSVGDYQERGGYTGLRRAIERLSPEEVIEVIERSGLRGRGGAGFPAAEKWRRARAQPSDRKIVVANLMSGDPTALGDRALAEGNPHLVLEGALIAAYAIGGTEVVLAVRRDWPLAIARLRRAIEDAEAHRYVGYLVLGTDVSITASVAEGSGAYVAGEETALIHALQGDRGMPLIRPPYPSERGLWGVPTVVQAGETLANVAWIVGHSVDEFRHSGTDASPGTKLVTLLGRVARPGLLEVAMGTPLREIVAQAGARDGAAAEVKSVFVGGPGGGCIPAPALDTPFDYEPLEAAGAVVGSGSILVADASMCMVNTARFFLDFSAREACGKAVPCRIGTKRLVEAIDRILAASPRPGDFTLLRDLSRKVKDTALCELEALAPQPMLTTLQHFPEEYRAHAERGECLAGACPAPRVATPLLAPLPGLDAPSAPAQGAVEGDRGNAPVP